MRAGTAMADNTEVSVLLSILSALGGVSGSGAAVKVDDAAFTPASSSVMVIGGQADESATDSVDEGDAGAIRMTLDRKMRTAPSGATAAGATLAENPITTGGLARTSPPTAVSNNQVVNAQLDIYGRAIAMSALREQKGIQKTTITSSASETTIVTADATYKLDIYRLTIANTSATAATVTIKDSTSGTTRAIYAVPAGQTVGFSAPCDSGMIQNAANNNWTATCTSVASIEITAEFVKNL
jgi:hypothetical protein